MNLANHGQLPKFSPADLRNIQYPYLTYLKAIHQSFLLQIIQTAEFSLTNVFCFMVSYGHKNYGGLILQA